MAGSEAKIIDGKAIAAELRGRVTGEVGRISAEHGLTPGLAVVLVGEDPASQVYVRNKERQATEAGMTSFSDRLPAETSEEELRKLIGSLNANPEVHGILVQLPLPPHINAGAIIDSIDPAKDVDGLHIINIGRLAEGLRYGVNAAMVPATPLGVDFLLRRTVGNMKGKRAMVLGRSNLVGKPVAQLLLQADCTVTLAHSKTVDLADECRRADILVAAVGRPQMVLGDWIKPGATVIDVGINRVPAPTDDKPGKTRLVGDVAFEEAVRIAGAITPVPGGVGPMTIACLLANSLTAACHQAGIEAPDLLSV